MNNQEKANEIGLAIGNGAVNVIIATAGALQMADWKDQQFKECLDKKRCEWKDGEDSYHHSIKARILSEIINELFGE